MPYSSPSLLVRYRGTIGTSSQTWSFGLRHKSASAGTPSGIAAIAAGIETPIRTKLASLFGLIGATGTFCTGVDIYSYASLPGRAVAQASKEFAVPIQPAGDSLPTMCAQLVSLRSDVPGAHHRGRVYLPMTRVDALETSGQIATAKLNGMGSGWATFFDAHNAYISSFVDQSKVCVISVTNNSADVITRAVMQSLVEVQRRREDKLSPAYSINIPVAN